MKHTLTLAVLVAIAGLMLGGCAGTSPAMERLIDRVADAIPWDAIHDWIADEIRDSGGVDEVDRQSLQEQFVERFGARALDAFDTAFDRAVDQALSRENE